MIRILDKLFDSILNWMENVQWNREARRRKRKRKKEAKARHRIQKKIGDAKRLLRDNGYALERNWQDIEYKGEKYTPFMIEEFMYEEKDSIRITARKYE